MRFLLIAAYVANLILCGTLLCQRTANVFADLGNTVVTRAWRTIAAPVATLAGLETLLLVAILLAPRLLRRCPAKWFSVPHADYWMQPAHRAEADRKVQARLLAFGTTTLLLLLVAGLFVFGFQRDPQAQPEWWGVRCSAIVFFVYSVYWYLAFLRDFRVPKSGE